VAIGALEGADVGSLGIGRQIPIAAFAIWTKFERHGLEDNPAGENREEPKLFARENVEMEHVFANSKPRIERNRGPIDLVGLHEDHVRSA